MTDTVTLPRSVVEQALNALWATDAEEGTEAYSRELEAIKALRAALEQTQGEQETVAWIERWYGSGPERGWWIVCGRDHIAHLGPAEMSGEAASKIVSAHNTSPPAQRQPLTDAQINDHRLALPYDGEDLPDPWDFKQGVRAAERVHKIGGEA